MALESLADRRAFFQDDGTVAVLASTTTNKVLPDGSFELLLERPVTGLFDRSYYETLDASGWNPVFCVVDEDAVHVHQGQRLMLQGHVFEVKDIEADGTGFTQLKLYWLGRYVVELAYGYGVPYGSLRYGAQTGTFDMSNPPLAYPFTIEGVYDNQSRMDLLTGS